MKRTWPRSKPRFTCPACGKRHALSAMDVAFARPDAALAVPRDEREERVIDTDDLTSVDRESFFVRGVLELGVHGVDDDTLALGVWARVAQEDFFRYVARYDDEDQASEPPFAGTVANMIPGYPPTLGVPVMVQLTSARKRPTLTVQPCEHPLAAEQRGGISPERGMRITAPYMHPGRAPAVGEPRFARMDEDAWTLQSARDRYHRRDGIYWLPPETELAALAPGSTAKLIFLFASCDTRGDVVEKAERMWVEIDHVAADEDGTLLSGVLTNRPFAPAALLPDTRVWFRPEHVMDVWLSDEERALSAREAMRCELHGVSDPCYVCRHLAHREATGFHQADAPEMLRPDAWCDACERVVTEEGGEWTDRAEDFADVTAVCGGCYDALEREAGES